MKKITVKFLMLSLITLFFACSKDDDAKPDNTAPIKPGITGSTVVIQAPQKLKTSEDPMAQQALYYIEMANAMSDNFTLFEVPAGAIQTSTPVTPINGRMSAGTKYYVYTWVDTNHQISYTYQVGEYSDKYTFEMFWKFKDDNGWTRLVYAEETKSKSAGKFIIYNFMGDDASEVLIRYDWTRSNNTFTLKIVMDNLLYDFEINTQTGAGKVKYYIANKLYYHITWDATGNGTWAQYNDDGSELQSGSWDS